MGLAFKVSAVGVGVAALQARGRETTFRFLVIFRASKLLFHPNSSGDFEMGSKLRRLEALEDPI